MLELVVGKRVGVGIGCWEQSAVGIGCWKGS